MDDATTHRPVAPGGLEGIRGFPEASLPATTRQLITAGVTPGGRVAGFADFYRRGPGKRGADG